MADEGRPEDRPDGWKDDNDKAGMDLRWHGHVLQAQTLALTQRCKDSMETLEDRDDRGARGVLKGLVEEYSVVNDSLAAFLERMSNANQGLVEMLQKSEEGRSSLMMRRAADLLVKALANAEEEVQSLQAELTAVEGQRDKYKRLLAKTNSELGLAQAYAQMNKATRQAAARATDPDARVGKASLEENGSPAAKTILTLSRGSEKGKAPARRQRPSREDNVGLSPSDTVASVRDLINAGIGNRADDGAKSRDGSISELEKQAKRSALVRPGRIKPGTAMWGNNGSKALSTGTGARESGRSQGKSAVAAAASSNSKRPRTLVGRIRFEDEYRGRTTVESEGGGSPLRLQDREGIQEAGFAREMVVGVDVTEWVEGGVSDGAELSRGAVGSSSSAAQDKLDYEDQSANDSDDAPSMFF